MQILFKIKENESNILENQILLILLKTDYKELAITKCDGSEKLVKITFSIDNKLTHRNLVNTLEAIGIQYHLSENSYKYKKITSNVFIPSDKLKYKYYNCNPGMVETISKVLQTNPHFYIQTMHLLNKFNINLEKVKKSNISLQLNNQDESSDDNDSEIEETMVIGNPEPVIKQFKREPNLKRPSVLGTGKIQMKFLKKK